MRDPEVVKKCQEAKAKTWAIRYPSSEAPCRYCSTPMRIPYARRAEGPSPKIYCSRDCQWKGHVNPNEGSDSRLDYVCVVCSEPFKTYRKDAIVCSKGCLGEFMSVTRRGANNPAFKADKETSECLTCGESFIKSRNGIHVGEVRLFCSQECSRVINFRGISINDSQGYPRRWNQKLKDEIKARDGQRCVLCDEKENERTHHVHHIDYDKNNLDPSNLTTLCQRCHNMTHGGRDVWREIFAELSALHREVTDSFIRLSNIDDTLRYLILRKRSSIIIQSSLDMLGYLCVFGQAKCSSVPISNPKSHVIYRGDFLDIKPDIEYHLTARLNTILKPCPILHQSPS